MKKLLITGGAGFIGANLVRVLLAAGYAVRVLDNFSTGRRGYLAGLDLELVEGDILDRQVVKAAVQGVSGVVHLAAQISVPDSVANPFHDCALNVTGTLNLLEACRHADIRRFVFASSMAPLGLQPPPVHEQQPPQPASAYGASKLAGEGYCSAYFHSWGLGTVILRFANVYGPFMGHANSVITLFFKNIASGEPLTVHGDGQQTRDFIYVHDLCDAIKLSLESRVSGEILHIGTGREHTILELTEQMARQTGQEIQLAFAAQRRGDIEKNYTAVNKAARVLGWTPQTTLAEGLAQTWAWFQAGSVAN